MSSLEHAQATVSEQAMRAYIETITPHCEHTGLRKPECACAPCIAELFERHTGRQI